MSATPDRFGRWRRSDDGAKESYLAEVGGSYLDDDQALALVNADHTRGTGRPPITDATVRMWARDDPEFAEALKAARQFREQDREHPARQQSIAPERWPSRSRLDLKADPYRVNPGEPSGGPHMSLADRLRSYGSAAREAERPEVKHAPVGQRFIPIEDMSPQALALANAQQGVRAGAHTSLFGGAANPDSLPQP